jgi:hypothetical protein
MEILMAQNKYVIGHATALSGAQWDSVLRIASASLDPAKQKIPWMKSFPSYYPAVAGARRAPVMTPRSERSWRTP